jgi:hypothetical protein
MKYLGENKDAGTDKPYFPTQMKFFGEVNAQKDGHRYY